MKLLNPTDDELNAAFAEKVAGWHLGDESKNEFSGYWYSSSGNVEKLGKDPMKFTTSADAVLPWLEKMPQWANESVGYGPKATRHYCRVFHRPKQSDISDNLYLGKADTFPRAAVIALLLAHGVEVEFK